MSYLFDEIYNLIVSFKGSNYYDVRKLKFSNDGKGAVLVCKPKLVSNRAKLFSISVKRDGNASGVMITTDLGEQSIKNNSLGFVLSDIRPRIIAEVMVSWLPKKHIKGFSNFSVPTKEWYVSKEVIEDVYRETLDLLYVAKELEKQGLYFEGCWEPSICRKLWISEGKRTRPIEKEEYQSMVKKMLSELIMFQAEKEFESNGNFVLDFRNFDLFRKRFARRLWKNKVKPDQLEEKVRQGILEFVTAQPR